MARTSKKEQAAQAAAAQEARIRAALRWTDPAPEPDVPPPSKHGVLTIGYTFNVYGRWVDVACSSVIGHAIGRTDKTTSQRPLALYSTRTLALRALRCALEREYAESLAGIDAVIEEEQQ